LFRAGTYEKEIVPTELRDIEIPGVAAEPKQRGEHE